LQLIHSCLIKQGIVMSVRWCLLLMTMGVVIPTSTVVTQEVLLVPDKSQPEELKLESSLSFLDLDSNKNLLLSKSKKNLISEMIASEENTRVKQFPAPQSTRAKIETSTSAKKANRIDCKAAFPEFSFPIKAEAEVETVVKNIYDVSLNQVK
jgi:hypothetical protein